MAKHTFDIETTNAWGDLIKPYAQNYVPKTTKPAILSPKLIKLKAILTEAQADVPWHTKYLDGLKRQLTEEVEQQKTLSDMWAAYDEPLLKPAYLVPTPRKVRTPVRAPKATKPLVSSDPAFLMGVEFEGLIRSSQFDAIEMAMYDLAQDADGEPLIQFGVDSSVDGGPRGFEPVEIRTSTLPIDECLVLFEQMLSILYLASESNDFVTNETCGLHINISEPNIFHGDQLSFYCRILKEFDESGILELFDRAACKHCAPFWQDVSPKTLTAIKKRYQACKRREDANRRAYGDKYWVDELNASQLTKYFSVALRDAPLHHSYHGPKLKSHRVEFRCIGNTDYHLRFDDLEPSINHMIETISDAFYAVRKTHA